MGRSKNKNKLQLKYSNNSNINKISNQNKTKEEERSVDENEVENAQNVLNNPILLNHINDIQNINENILVWNDDDVIDDNKSKVFHQMVKSEIIKKSIKKSAFSKYLKQQLQDINIINSHAVSGVIMKSDDLSDKNSIILNEISSNNYTVIETKKQIAENLKIVDLPEEIENVDANSQQLKLSEVVTGLDERPVRRSGRSAKINYKEMLNVQIFEVMRPSEQHNADTISPKKKSRVKREVPKRMSINESSEDKVEKEEHDKSARRSANLTKFELEAEVKKEIVTNEDLSELIDDSKMLNNKEEEAQNQLKHEEEDRAERDENEDNSKKERAKKAGSPSKKRFSKDVTRHCVLCARSVMGSKKFTNLCYKCVVSSSKVISRLKLKGNEDNDANLLMCLAVPPCWERSTPGQEDEENLCDACYIQNMIKMGVEWGPDLDFMSSFSLEQLRSADAVTKSRLASQKEIKSLLSKHSGKIDSHKSCIMNKNKPLSAPCKWDIRYFTKQSSEAAICNLCQAKPTEENDQFYLVLPDKEHSVCHKCLLAAHTACNADDPAPPCATPCPDLQQCPSCLLTRIGTLCPADSFKYRYCDTVDNCEICLRKDPHLMSTTREGNLVCQICIGRIKLFHFSQSQPCEKGTCSIGQCDACLVELAGRVVDVHQITTNRISANFKLSRRSSKRPIDDPESTASKPKRQCITTALPISVVASSTPISPSTDDQRPRRIIKTTQFNDFIVDNCLLRTTIDRPARASLAANQRKPVESEAAIAEMKPEKTDNVVEQQTEPDAIKMNDESMTKNNGVKEESVEDDKYESAVDKSESVAEDEYESAADDRPAVLVGAPEEHSTRPDEQQPATTTADGKVEELANEELSKPCRRIKQAMQTVHNTSKMEPQQTVTSATPAGAAAATATVTSRPNGPRVKQVSRQNVNAEVSLDNSRQKCVVKRGNRVIKKPESLTNFITDHDDRVERRIAESDAEDEEKETRPDGKEQEMLFHIERSISHENDAASDNEGRCGICSGCLRNRCCGKCDPCLLNKSQRRKTEICVKMACTHRTRAQSNRNRESVSQEVRLSSSKLSTIQPLDSSLENGDKSVDEIVPADQPQQLNGANDLYVSEVYRDSDSDDLSSEEEQLDPELDSIHTVKGDLITAGLAHEGGFPVITSVKAQPNKILCFSCGSGGDQMIHCVSCAEPFHFFCIEYQFRPKSKEMFVCRNCTKCHTCQGYGSDLKCIKCQLGFHPRCVIKYPPSKSEDRSNWACYKCAMCLHCGAKAEDLVNHLGKNDFQIDWSKDPWQCGRCARARKDGCVCPECGRAYQSGLETVECSSCAGMVHRQCSGLTEDEFEIFKNDPEANRESSTFTCSKCVPAEVEDDQKKRVRLKRQCKESGLKKYCERGVSRKMNELIHKGETHEEMLLEQHNLSDLSGYNRCSMSNNQFDGVDDEFDKSGVCDGSAKISLKDYDTATNSSPSAAENYDREMNQTNSTMFYSSESTGECDMEPLNIMDLEPHASKVDIDVELEAVLAPRAKIGIFSRLNASEFISPKHLVMEALARINIKLSRYPTHSQIHKIYDKFLVYIQDLNEQIFPWVDFSSCLETVQAIVKKYAGRVRLILQALAENVSESRNREFDVFSSSISEIEEKLSNSFQRGREEFIIFHSEQHLAGLMKSMECRSSSALSSSEKDQYTSYRLAFGTEFNTAICEKDVRSCVLCGVSGDDGLEGRLIYGGLDVWVHVNCALWSDDVYEMEDGALVNVDLAIKQGQSSLCCRCSKHGATVRCSAQDSLTGFGDCCSNIYHFACAFNSLTDPVFTESRSFYCSDSHTSYVQSDGLLGLEDMPILRRIYLPQGCLGGVSTGCSDGMPSEEVVVTIGNLRINCLGKIDPCSDSQKVYLCPLGYQARRLFWSMNELDSLVMYFMSIKKEPIMNKLSEGISPAMPAPVSNPPIPAPIRRRMIEMPEQRAFKRPKTMGGVQEIIYEMDDAGNLQPISGSAMKIKQPPILSNFLCPEITTKKVNRRFPITGPTSTSNNRMTESRLEIVPCPVESNPPRAVSVPSTSYTHSDAHVHLSSRSTATSRQSLVTFLPQNAPKSGELSSMIPHKPRFPAMKPVMLRFSPSAAVSTQQRSLPASILHQLNLNKNPPKPVTFISVAQPINALTSMGCSSTTVAASNNNGNRVLKLVKMTDKNAGQTGTIISRHVGALQHQQLPPPQVTRAQPATVRIISSSQPIPSNPNNPRTINTPSVLRTVLTDNILPPHRFVQNRPQINSSESSSYHISSCGSLVAPSTGLSQYDGEADDALSVLTADDSQLGSADTLCCCDQNSVATVASRSRTTTTTTTSTSRQPRTSNLLPYKFCLKFHIHGFKSSKSPKSGWSYLARRVGQVRKSQGLDEYELKVGDGWSKFGLDHRHVIYLIEQMVGAFQCTNYEFKFHKDRVNKLRQQCLPEIPSANGCARFSPWVNTKPEHFSRDPLAFLLSKSNLPPKNYAPANADQNDENPDPDDDYLQTLATQFRNLQNGVESRENNVRVCCSNIHGRGLFARRLFDAHEIIIEYVGEIIRSVLSDVRESEYQRTGVDCYMFRLDQDNIVDATFKGNAARFINHSCHPNCYAKVVRFEGEKHIIIIAQRRIFKGEELTYDYRFPIEDDKLPCTCGSFSCKKYLN